MLICVYADNHWSSYSSVVRSRGMKYSTRLENQIASLNWVERLAETKNCSKIISLGDFFDKSELNSEEVTALGEIEWSDIKHTFIVGNHEISIGTSEYSTAHAFCMRDFMVIDEPDKEYLDNLELCYLPYLNSPKTLNEYFGKKEKGKRRIVFSHNDVAGIQFGMYVSKEGISVDSIETECDLFLNGHLHNRSDICKHAGNIGNLTGQNFSEDAHAFNHCAVILDTDTLECEFIENPHAFNFYKHDATETDRDTISNIITGLFKTSILSIKVNDTDESFVRELISNNKHIIESRVIINYTAKETEADSSEKLLQLDHIQQFREFVLQNIGSDEITVDELNMLCK